MSEYTPGPWVIFIDRDEAEFVVMPAMRAGQIATVWAKDAGDAIASANANLIAAAPDLLEALKNATFALALIAQANGNEDYLKAACAAIAKAEKQT